MSDSEWMKTCLLIATLAELTDEDRREWKDEVLQLRPGEENFCNITLEAAARYAN